MITELVNINTELKILIIIFIVIIAIVILFDSILTSALIITILTNCLFGYFLFNKQTSINTNKIKKNIQTNKPTIDLDELLDVGDDSAQNIMEIDKVIPHDLEFAGSQDQVYYMDSPYLEQYRNELGESNNVGYSALNAPPPKSTTHPYGKHPEYNYNTPYGCGRTTEHSNLDMQAHMHGGDSNIMYTGQYGENDYLQHNANDPNMNLSHGTHEGFRGNQSQIQQWMNSVPGSNPKYTACYDPKSTSDISTCNLVGHVPYDEKNMFQVASRERSKRTSDGWATKNANYFKKHGFEEELDETENERWWGANEY